MRRAATSAGGGTSCSGRCQRSSASAAASSRPSHPAWQGRQARGPPGGNGRGARVVCQARRLGRVVQIGNSSWVIVEPEADLVEELPMSIGTLHSVTNGAPQQKEEVTREDTKKWGEIGSVIRFSLPAIGIFLMNPLMSLIDTAFLGGGPIAEQAALNPSSVVLDYPTILVSFLAVGTTSMIARSPNSKEAIHQVLRPALYLGFLLGLLLLVGTHLGTPFALESLGVTPEVAKAAAEYISVRQLFCPLVLVSSIAQSTYLASKDVLTPLKIVLASGLVNATGDFILVGKLGMGIAGAAWATLASQLVLSASLLSGLYRRGLIPPMWPLPTLRDYVPFAGFAKGITTINALRVSGFFACTYYASCFLSTQHLAAQQVIVSVYVFLSMLAQPLLQCCQALLPSLLPGGADEDAFRARSTVKAILTTAASVGLLTGVTGSLVILFFHGSLTSDPRTVGLMHEATLAVLACYVISPVALSLDAVLVAARELDLLCWTQLAGLITLVGSMTVAGHVGLGLSAIWIAYGAHLVMRLCLLAVRVYHLPGLGRQTAQTATA